MSRESITRRELMMTVAVVGSSLVQGQVLAAPCKVTMTTLFWIGEDATPDNGFIANRASYWDADWETHYGGIDDPERRNGYWPAKFKPKENPFYVALPYGEFVKGYQLKAEAKRIPWYRPDLSPLLKNHWVEIRRGGRSCYAQWEDVGPNGEDDFDFVFGNATKPHNRFGVKAGLDVSPAVFHYLGMSDNGLAAWRFIDGPSVPDGPWSEIVTTSGNNRGGSR